MNVVAGSPTSFKGTALPWVLLLTCHMAGCGWSSRDNKESSEQLDSAVLDDTSAVEEDGCPETLPDCSDGTVAGADADGDGFPSTGLDPATVDCNDEDPWIYPGAPEICDDVDDDCDGEYLLEQDAYGCTVWFEDADKDDYGIEEGGLCFCDDEGEAPEGTGLLSPTDKSGDCDDGDAEHAPGALPQCDDYPDDDCDGIPEVAVEDGDLTIYLDQDEDLLGVRVGEEGCPDPASLDSEVAPDMICICSPALEAMEDAGLADGWTSPESTGGGLIHWGGGWWSYRLDATDCLDSDPGYGCSDLYPDADGDGFGAAGAATECVCPFEAGYVGDDGDCNDADRNVYPGATEACDALDADCDGDINDTDGSDGSLFYRDADGDGYGRRESTRRYCSSAGAGYSSLPTDCDDRDPEIHPCACERCDDDVDNDCDNYSDALEAICGCADLDSSTPCDSGGGAEACDTADTAGEDQSYLCDSGGA